MRLILTEVFIVCNNERTAAFQSRVLAIETVPV